MEKFKANRRLSLRKNIRHEAITHQPKLNRIRALGTTAQVMLRNITKTIREYI
jgi:hypothetical protein